MTNFSSARATRGFTLAEMVVALGMFTIILGITAAVILNSFSADRRTRVAQETYNETRIAIERMVKEIRRGTVDYEEYWNWSRCAAGSCDAAVVTNADTRYGKNYGFYGIQFFRKSGAVPDSPTDKDRYFENVGENDSGFTPLPAASAHPRCADIPTAITDGSGHTQCELYLITGDGTEKTIIRAEVLLGADGVTPLLGTRADGTTYRQYQLTMLKMTGSDSNGDGQIDAFVPMADFGTVAAPRFVPIQPDTIVITDLRFIITPLEDPRKAFANFSDGVQIHPQVTILLAAEPSQALRGGMKTEMVPNISLQTMVSARAQNEVTSVR